MTREPAQGTLVCEDFARYFKNVIDALSKCISPKQMLNMDESGVTARRFEGKKRKVVSLTYYQTESRFQDARGVTHASIVAIVSLSLNSLPPLFLKVSTCHSRT
jgi:hypothetical protein